ncbi:DegT/DnrJ/EryC1/StrS family aminotransferase [Kitasatospora sp. NPDC056138]|uniref:DegT/DnrJ/EryC1/StrS family aminotransferase n=1 Tax=Kitasatospora sp. NPDC056138 TaxID=3345724 RepID=UPI0035E329E1
MTTQHRLQERIEARIRENLLGLVDSKQWNIYRGRFVNAVQARAEELLGVPCLTTNAGTSAIELALRAHGIGPGDDVVIPSSTFVATAQAVLLTGARPVLCDVDDATFNPEPEHVAAVLTPGTKAVLFVHTFGNPSGAGRVAAFCAERGLLMLEDAAQALGGRLGGRPIGSLGDGAAFSFNTSKPVSCGDGGMFAAADPEVYERAKAIRHAGLREVPDGRFLAHEIGGKSLMTEFQAAVLEPQLDVFEELARVRVDTALLLREQLPKVSPHARLQHIDDDAVSAWQRVAITLDTPARAEQALVEHPWLERFYAAALVDEPVVARHAVYTEEIAHRCRDQWGRLVGVTLWPFQDFAELVGRTADLKDGHV